MLIVSRGCNYSLYLTCQKTAKIVLARNSLYWWKHFSCLNKVIVLLWCDWLRLRQINLQRSAGTKIVHLNMHLCLSQSWKKHRRRSVRWRRDTGRRTASPTQWSSGTPTSCHTGTPCTSPHLCVCVSVSREFVQHSYVAHCVTVYLCRKGTRRVRELWWQGLPPSVRGRVWSLAIGNELNITPGTNALYTKLFGLKQCLFTCVMLELYDSQAGWVVSYQS